MKKKVETTYTEGPFSIDHETGEEGIWLHFSDGAGTCMSLTLTQVDELHRFLGAFLEEIERAKEGK